MKKRYIIMGAILLSTIVLISSICVGLLINHNKENGNVHADYKDFIRKENDQKTVALPTASTELESQIKEVLKDKDKVKPRVDTVDPKYYTLDYEIKNSIGCGVDELEFTDIPVGKTFVYEGLELTITDYSIMTGKEFVDKYFDEEDKKIPESELDDYYDLTKGGTYAVVYYSFEKIEDEATYVTDEMLFTDMDWYGFFDFNLTGIVKEYLGKTGKRRLMDIPVGEHIDAVGVLGFTEPTDSDELFILIHKVSGKAEKSLVVEGKMTQEEAWTKYQENKTKFYRIKLVRK